MHMYTKSKGSILLTTVVVFSIIIIICMTCVGLNYSNLKIYNLEYIKVKMDEKGWSSIELVHSNIVKDVMNILENSQSEEEFNQYFLTQEFKKSTTDISYSDLKGVSINIPNKIVINEVDKTIEFKINSKVKDKNYSKDYEVSVKIKNPYYKVENNNQVKSNINEMVKVYDYKEV